MISHFTGGNTMQPPEPVLSRAEWERRYRPVPIRDDRRLLGTKAHDYCPCGTRLHEPRGEEDYCPQCRPRYDLTVAQVFRDLAAKGYGGSDDVPDIH